MNEWENVASTILLHTNTKYASCSVRRMSVAPIKTTISTEVLFSSHIVRSQLGEKSALMTRNGHGQHVEKDLTSPFGQM